MKGAEEDYLELDKQIRQMESTHPGYDEYRYQLDEIGHDPYQLISHLTAVYEQFTRGQVKPVIKELFKQQYILKVWETIEIRTRMETRVGIRPTIDAFGNISMETYTYQEEVEYEYKILNVLLKNKGFDTIAWKNIQSMLLSTKRPSSASFSYMDHPLKLFAVSLDYPSSILQVVLVFVYGRLFIIWTIIKNNRLIYSLSRGLASSSPLSFCQSFHFFFLHPAESDVFSKVRVCAAKRSNESPSGAFKRPNGLAQQDGGASPRQVRGLT